jgi:DNA-binding winged helix-turn-helix (wHTH) protein
MAEFPPFSRDARLWCRTEVGDQGSPANEPTEGNRTAAQGSGAILFGEFCLAPAARMLTRNGLPVHLGGRALDILIALIGRAGQLVSKAELFAFVWPRAFVEESNLRVNVATLRKALGDGLSGKRFIVNVPGRGYTFVGDVERIPGGRARSP